MKKFWIGFLTLVLTLCGVVSFSACSKNTTYNLSQLKNSYQAITEGCSSATISGGKIQFNYANFKVNNESYFQQVISSTAPYTRLTDFYNPLFEKSMSFVYEYIDVCSNKSIKVDEQTKLSLDNDLNALKVALKNVDDHVSSLADNVKFVYNGDKNYTSIACSQRYTALFNSYDALFSSALNFSYDISNIYFNYAVKSALIDYSKQTVEEFNASTAVINLKSQTDNQILNLTRAYFNAYVKGNALTSTFVTPNAGQYAKPDQNYKDFSNSVSQVSLDASFEASLPEKMEIINTDQTLKNKFYEQSVALSNIQQIMNNDIKVYQIALNDIVYLDKKADPNATDYEKLCVQMIENHNYIVQEYNKVLVNLIAIINDAGV